MGKRTGLSSDEGTLDYCHTENRISVRFEYEWRDADNPNQWMCTHGNEHWEFEDNGLMRLRDMSANDYAIQEASSSTVMLFISGYYY